MPPSTSPPTPAIRAILIACVSAWCAVVTSAATSQYYGTEVGPLSELHHAVRGRLYAIDSRTLFLKDFHYDGEGPTAYFYVGTSKTVGPSGGKRLRDERGGASPLRRYRGEDITLSLPDGMTLRDIRWFSVWCDEFAVNFGDVSIPPSLEYPKPVKVGALRGVHGVSSDPVVVVDAQTLLVPNFSYDGEAPDAKFWVGRGDKPSPQGIRIPDENGKENPLRKYDRKTIVLTLPGELTVFDIGHFGVWCEAFTVNFGHVTLPRARLVNIPPSLKMLGVSPQSRNKELQASNGSEPGEGAGEGKARGRRPLQRLDATTYRPHLRPGGAPLAAFHQSPHTSLHRRADDYTLPPPTQPTEPQQLLQDDKTSQQTDKSDTPDPSPSQPQTEQPPQPNAVGPQQQQQQQQQQPQQLQQQQQQQQLQQQDQYYTQLKSEEIYTGHFDAPEFYQFQPQFPPQYNPQYQAQQYQLQDYQQQQYQQQLLAQQYQQQYQPFQQQYGQYQLLHY